MCLQSGQALFFLMDLIEAVREGDHADKDGQTELDHEIDDPADQGEDEEDIGGDPGQDGPAAGDARHDICGHDALQDAQRDAQKRPLRDTSADPQYAAEDGPDEKEDDAQPRQLLDLSALVLDPPAGTLIAQWRIPAVGALPAQPLPTFGAGGDRVPVGMMIALHFVHLKIKIFCMRVPVGDHYSKYIY